MIVSPALRIVGLGTLLSLAALAQEDAAAKRSDTPLRRLAADHVEWCYALYGRVRERAGAMQRAIHEFLAAPSPRTLATARAAWIDARKLYGETEALRFHDGPIEPLEPLLNAWPVDEAYIDYVVGRPDCGMIQNPERYPSLDRAILQLANERGGEANICVGWHAIEFMLWGQDRRADGPGERSHLDFVPGERAHAERRAAYLRAVTGLLVEHLSQLESAWAPGAPYRERFLKDPQGAVKRMLTGITVLTAFELGGERMTVAYDTQDQEQEHSCFSDTTHNDFVANQRGLAAVALGARLGDRRIAGIVDLLRESAPAMAEELTAAVGATAAALAAMPKPFDQAFLGADDGPGRTALRAAIAALEHQTDVLLIVGNHLGYDLPLEPGG